MDRLQCLTPARLDHIAAEFAAAAHDRFWPSELRFRFRELAALTAVEANRMWRMVEEHRAEAADSDGGA